MRRLTNRIASFAVIGLGLGATAVRGQVVNLGLPAGTWEAVARGISADGRTVVGTCTSDTGSSVAFR